MSGLPDMSRRMLVFLRSAGDPKAETDVREALRGVVIFCSPEMLFNEVLEETRLMLTESAVPMCGIERRFWRLLEDVMLADDSLF